MIGAIVRQHKWQLIVALVAASSGVVFYWLYHLSMHAHPERIYSHYSSELEEYGRRLGNEDAQYESGRGYAVPQFLIDKGAKSVTKHGGCFVVWFTSTLDNPTPALWYSSAGLEPVPSGLVKVVGESDAGWRQLSPNWGASRLPWWLNP